MSTFNNKMRIEGFESLVQAVNGLSPNTAESIGELIYNQTAEEAAAGVTPTAYRYPPGDVRRYGASVSASAATNDAAFAAAIATTHEIFIPVGTWNFNKILVDVNGQAGRKIRGESVTNTILRVSGTQTDAFHIRGVFNFTTLTGYYNQYNVIENFTLDVSQMPNSTASRGLRLEDCWGTSVRNVNIANGPLLMREMFVGPTVYTSVFDNCDFGSTTGIIELAGDPGGALDTTLTFIGCSFGQCIANEASCCTFIQPIVQGDLNKFVLSNIYNFTIFGGDIENGGTYLVIGSNVNGLVSLNNALVGFTGTYSTGTMVSGYLMDMTNAPWQLATGNGTTTAAEYDGSITEMSALASLIRKLIRNTNATSQQVDLQFQNANGSTFVGQTASGDSYLDARGTGKVALQQTGVDRLGVTATNRILVGTSTANTATAGSNGAVPAQVSGYLVIDIGGTDFKVPYFAN